MNDIQKGDTAILNWLLFLILVTWYIWVASNHIPAKFYEPLSVDSWFVMLCVKIQMLAVVMSNFILFDFIVKLHAERQT